jgi:hypothetical protein
MAASRSPEEQPRGHLEGQSGVASGKHGDGLAQQKCPVEQLARAGPLAFQATGEGSDLLVRECIGCGTEGEPREAVLHRPSPQLREGGIW